MKIWVDAQLSPAIARWMREQLGVEAIAVRDLGLRDATDYDIFMTARLESAVVMTKDSDFIPAATGVWNTTADCLVNLWKYLQCTVTTDLNKDIRSGTGIACNR